MRDENRARQRRARDRYLLRLLILINFEKFNIDFKKHSEITHYSNKGTFVDNAEAVTEGKFVTDEHDSINQGKNQGQV